MLTLLSIVLLLFILIDVVRLHKKIDKLSGHLNPVLPPPTDEEIEKMLTSKNTNHDK
ncbi:MULTISPECIES: hypothetical protein [unclassified Bacillus (in: firmicutes)]|jgi:hypothetical protein|uniref:hypothetical protein n=1 Tax=unclassified Bacillus (in: firmicutes) TaxID=185979 RepID=UPI001BE88CEB|nr:MULTISPECIES: hypothetical protein [unclassified Bacillus (in: firmicutes)]MBT2682468.1 hypothetical protein [Bacillus sp. ISL-37]MBT2691991.1 hypothetical protein [Bacillus sp. ISL-55]